MDDQGSLFVGGYSQREYDDQMWEEHVAWAAEQEAEARFAARYDHLRKRGPAKHSHCWKILKCLEQGGWWSTARLHREAGHMIVHSRISDLRKMYGLNVQHRHVAGRSGAEASEYRLVVG